MKEAPGMRQHLNMLLLLLLGTFIASAAVADSQHASSRVLVGALKGRALQQNNITKRPGQRESGLQATIVGPTYAVQSGNDRVETCLQLQPAACDDLQEADQVAQLYCLYRGYLSASDFGIESAFDGYTVATGNVLDSFNWGETGAMLHNVFSYIVCDGQTGQQLVTRYDAPKVPVTQTAEGGSDVTKDMLIDACYDPSVTSDCTSTITADLYCRANNQTVSVDHKVSKTGGTTVFLRTVYVSPTYTPVVTDNGDPFEYVVCMTKSTGDTAEERRQPRILVYLRVDFTSTVLQPVAAAGFTAGAASTSISSAGNSLTGSTSATGNTTGSMDASTLAAKRRMLANVRPPVTARAVTARAVTARAVTAGDVAGADKLSVVGAPVVHAHGGQHRSLSQTGSNVADAFVRDLRLALTQEVNVNLTTPQSLASLSLQTASATPSTVTMYLKIILPSHVYDTVAAYTYLAPTESDPARIFRGVGVTTRDLMQTYGISASGGLSVEVLGASLPNVILDPSDPSLLPTYLIPRSDLGKWTPPPYAPPAPPYLLVETPTRFERFWIDNGYRNTYIVCACVGGGTLLLLVVCVYCVMCRRQSLPSCCDEDSDGLCCTSAQVVERGSAGNAQDGKGSAISRLFFSVVPHNYRAKPSHVELAHAASVKVRSKRDEYEQPNALADGPYAEAWGAPAGGTAAAGGGMAMATVYENPGFGSERTSHAAPGDGAPPVPQTMLGRPNTVVAEPRVSAGGYHVLASASGQLSNAPLGPRTMLPAVGIRARMSETGEQLSGGGAPERASTGSLGPLRNPLARTTSTRTDGLQQSSAARLDAPAIPSLRGSASFQMRAPSSMPGSLDVAGVPLLTLAAAAAAAGRSSQPGAGPDPAHRGAPLPSSPAPTRLSPLLTRRVSNTGGALGPASAPTSLRASGSGAASTPPAASSLMQEQGSWDQPALGSRLMPARQPSRLGFSVLGLTAGGGGSAGGASSPHSPGHESPAASGGHHPSQHQQLCADDRGSLSSSTHSPQGPPPPQTAAAPRAPIRLPSRGLGSLAGVGSDPTAGPQLAVFQPETATAGAMPGELDGQAHGTWHPEAQTQRARISSMPGAMPAVGTGPSTAPTHSVSWLAAGSTALRASGSGQAWGVSNDTPGLSASVRASHAWPSHADEAMLIGKPAGARGLRPSQSLSQRFTDKWAHLQTGSSSGVAPGSTGSEA